MKLTHAIALAATILGSGVASAAQTYDFVAAPIIASNGQPLKDNGGYTDGRTFYFSIAADQIPDVVSTYAGFKYPNYRVVSYGYSNFGSSAVVILPPIIGRNIVFFDYINQGGLILTQNGNPPSSGSTQLHLFGDTVNNDMSEVLYNDAAYKAALATNPSAQPDFKLGTILLSTFPRNGSPTQPIQNYSLSIGLAGVAGAVPEPGSWALMIVGIGAVGGSLRRRPKGKITTRVACA